MTAVPASERPKVSLLYNPRVRTIAYQTLLCAVIAFLAWSAINNAIENLRRAHIASGFEFWKFTSGFDISQTLIDYSSTSTYGRAFWVGLINTLVVAGIGIVLATIVGFLAGIARLSSMEKAVRLSGFTPMATMRVSNSFDPSVIIHRCPIVNGSKLPAYTAVCAAILAV